SDNRRSLGHIPAFAQFGSAAKNVLQSRLICKINLAALPTMAARKYRDVDMAAKLADVAALAQLGESTVSRVLRGEGSFSSAAREKVLNAVAELGYVPNRLASSLASAGSRLVAIIVPSLA